MIILTDKYLVNWWMYNAFSTGTNVWVEDWENLYYHIESAFDIKITEERAERIIALIFVEIEKLQEMYRK